jgi:hypothetical protein
VDETLSFDFSAPKMGHLLQVVNMQEHFPLWKLGGGFKAAAVTTLMSIIHSHNRAIVAAPGLTGPANPPARSTSDYISFTMVLQILLPHSILI